MRAKIDLNHSWAPSKGKKKNPLPPWKERQSDIFYSLKISGHNIKHRTCIYFKNRFSYRIVEYQKVFRGMSQYKTFVLYWKTLQNGLSFIPTNFYNNAVSLGKLTSCFFDSFPIFRGWTVVGCAVLPLY